MKEQIAEIKVRKDDCHFPDLSVGEVHIWNTSLNVSPLKMDKYKRTLADIEIERMNFFKFQKAKESFVVSQGVLKTILSEYLKIPTKDVLIGRQIKGKPYCINNPKLNFNMTNSGDQLAIAFSLDGELGIDIEKIRPIPDLTEMICENFTPNEVDYIISRSAEKEKRFFRFWTVKEAYLKAIGEGMRLLPENIEFNVKNGVFKLIAIQGIPELEEWYFNEFTVADNYVGTLAHGCKDVEIKNLNLI